MVSLTLTPFAPWHAAQTVAALALPASISAACANGATARARDNPRIFFMGLLLCTLYKDARLHPEPGTDNDAVSDDTGGVVHLFFSCPPCNTHCESSTQGGSNDDTPNACTLSGRRHRARRQPGTGRDEAPMGRIQPGRRQPQTLPSLRQQPDRPAAYSHRHSSTRS